jgi:hypothetical protein
MLCRHKSRCSQSAQHILTFCLPHVGDSFCPEVVGLRLAWEHRLVGVVICNHAEFGEFFDVILPDKLPVRPFFIFLPCIRMLDEIYIYTEVRCTKLAGPQVTDGGDFGVSRLPLGFLLGLH